MKNIKIEIKWAIIFVIMGLIWLILERVFGLHSTYIEKHAIYSNFIAIPSILCYILALIDKRKNFFNGKMTYMQGVISGLIITGVIALLSPLSQIIISNLISPDFFPNAIQHAVEAEKMTQTVAEGFFNLKNYIIQGVIGTVMMGLMTTLIVAIFTRRK